MTCMTLQRNQPGLHGKVLAQAGFAFIACAALVETIFASLLTLGSLFLLPCSVKPFLYTVNWISSSSFSLMWSLCSFFVNPFMDKMVADEASACAQIKSRTLKPFPIGSLI